ncbi:MAG: hypothetical protein EXR74_05235 [Bdellovibrionales bacterium]|nr:hypothetical protein [Bdellovibrionales bacterium]
MLNKKFDIIYYFIFSLLFLVTSCTVFQAPTVAPKSLKVIFVLPTSKSISTECNESPCMEKQSLTMEGLFRLSYKNNQLTLNPTLADSVSFPSDHKLLIHLKKQILWSEGTPLTASHFITSWKKILTSHNLNKASLLFSITNARSFFDGNIPFSEVGIHEIDSHTLSITFNQDSATFLWVLANPIFWPTLEIRNPKKNEHIPSLGPFFDSKASNKNNIFLTKNLNYWGPASALNKIEIISVTDSHIAKLAFEDREVPLVIGAVPGMNSAETDYFEGRNRYLLLFNPKSPFFRLTSIRKSFLQSINKNEWNKILHLNVLLPTTLDLFSTIPFKIPSAEPIFNNKIEDSSLEFFTNLKKGLTKEKTKPLLVISYQQSPLNREITQNLQMQWLKQWNLEVELDSWTPIKNTKRSQTSLRAPDLLLLPIQRNYFAYGEGLKNIFQRTLSMAEPKNAAPIMAQFKLFKTQRFTSPEAAHKIFNQAESFLIDEEAVFYPLFSDTQTIYRDPNLSGIIVDPNGGVNLAGVKF